MANRTETPDFLTALASTDHWLILVITAALVGTTVFLHYEGLERLNYSISSWSLKQRPRVLALIIFIMALHITEIWIFGIGIYLTAQYPNLGHVAGADPLMLLDAIYVSAVTFTTVGYGDLTPDGPIRLIFGTEALTGFVLVTWSASFTYLEMQRYWRPR